MVFESLVVDLLNRFLGAYVENLDASQLKLGIWGGDAVLQNLDVKEGALDELDLPVKIKSGHLGKLTLQIPWKNLYSAPVVATLEGLYILVTPNSDIKYDAEKDAKQKFEAKQRTLQRVEDAKKKQAEQGKEQDPKTDSFAEKLATNVIKNLQVKISDIHVRYEDRTTNPDAPISIGATLHNLSLSTTNDDWKECVLDETAKLIHKMLRLDNLAVYWNSNSQMYSSMERSQSQNLMRESIASDDNIPKDYHYVVEPISSQAQLRINPKPANDLSHPQAWLNLVINSIGLALRQNQFRDIMLTLESFERMARNDPFRKYKPDCPAKGNAKKWWHYAYTCVLEETVRRRHRMWSWENIRKHRRNCKEYTAAYLKKLDTSKPGKDMIANLETYEKELSVFAVTMCRQQAELDFVRLGLKRKKDKAEAGWFGGWFGGGKKKEEKKPGQLDDIADQFASVMTLDEKNKLYAAIGYSEKAADPTLPKEYIGIDANVHLKQTYIKLVDDSRAKPEILNMSLTDLVAGFQQRPSAEAIKLDAKIEDLSVFGTAVGEKRPQMVESLTFEADNKVPLLSLLFETNPLDGKADQRIRLNTTPLKIVYDANTVNQIAKFFEPPDDVHLEDLSAAAASSLVDITEQSSTGMQYMVDNKSVLDLKIDVKASYVIVPESGVNDGNGSVLILDLGNFKMHTVTEERPTGRRLANESLDVLMEKAYDKFNIELQSVQVILATQGDDWQAARHQDSSPLHLLQPLELTIGLHKCMIEDPRLAKLKVNGELPDMSLDISDYKIHELVKLFGSIPFPEGKKQTAHVNYGKDTQFMDNTPESALIRMAANEAGTLHGSSPPSEDGVSDEAYYENENVGETFVLASENPCPVTIGRDQPLSDVPSKMAVGDSDEEFHSADDEEGTPVGRKPMGMLTRQESKADSQRSNLELQFELKKIALNVFQRVSGIDEPLMSLSLHSLGVGVKMRPWDMSVEASLGSVSIEHKQYKALDGSDLFLVKTPTYDAKAGRVLTLRYLKAEPKNPEFHTTYGSTEQDITINFTTLQVVAHAEAILNLTEFADNLVASLDDGKKVEDSDEASEDEGYLSEEEKKPARRRKKKIQPVDTIDVKITAILDVISLTVCTKSASLTDIKIKGLEAGVLVQKHMTTVDARLEDITIIDPTSGAIHPKILSTLDKEVFKMRIQMYNGATAGDSYSDMKAVDMRVGLNIGCIRAVFLNKYVMDLLAFVDLFSRAKAKVAEAGADAAASVQKTVGDMHERNDRIALDISIKAPIIVVPKSSKSDKALVADLGSLKVQNEFTVGEGTEGQENPAVLDTMNVDLQSLQLSRAIIENETTKSEVNILQPMSLHIGLTRNLAAAWYHKSPAIAVAGKLEAIKLFIGPDDFGVIMGILSENLPEGEEERKASADAAATGGAGVQKASSKTASQTTAALQDTQAEVAVPKEEGGEVWQNMKLDFEFEGITASLYGAKLELRPLSGKVERPLSDPLGEFIISELKASVTMNSDNSMIATAILGTVQLDDIRPDRPGKMTRMLGLRPMGQDQEEEDNRKMVSVFFEQKANQDKNVDATINSIQACICVEFLMTIADIFTKGMEESAAHAAEKKARAPAAAAQTAQQTTEVEEAAPSQGTMTIHAKLEQPEIVLVADVSKEDTNALFLKMEGKVDLVMNEDTMVINGGLHGLRIDACPYNPSKRKGKTSKVLLPCNIDFNLTAPKGQGQHISFTIPEIMLNISPETIKILSATSQSLTPPQAEVSGTKAVVPADTWEAKKLADCRLWFLQEEEGIDVDQLLEEVVGGTAGTEAPRGEELVATIGSIVIKLEAVIGRRTVPTLALEAGMNAVVKDWSTQLKVESHLAMEVSCYNDKAGAWEPLLEPVEYEAGKYRPWDLCLEVIKNDLQALENSTVVSTNADDEEGIDLAPPVMTINVTSSDILELTVTKTCLVMLGKLGEAFGAAMSDPDTKLQDSEEIPACKIINKLGLPLVLTPGSYYESPKDAKMSIKSNEAITLDMSQSLKSTIKMKSFLKGAAGEGGKDISIQVEGFQELRKIPITRAGNMLYNLTPVPSKKPTSDMVFSVVLEIKANMDTRDIIIRSPLQFHNHFSTPMEIYTRVSTWTEKFGVIEPNEIFSVPLNIAYKQALLVKPALKNLTSTTSQGEGTVDEERAKPKLTRKGTMSSHQLCDQTILWSNLWEQRKQGKRSITFKCPAKTQGYTPYFFNIVTEMDDLRHVKGSSTKAPKFILHIHPVVVLRNLLPIPVTYTLQGTGEEITIASTEQTLMSNVEMGKTMMFMTIPNYLGCDWRGEMTLRNSLKEFIQWGFRGGSAQDSKMFEIGVWSNSRSGYLEIAIFSTYWLINKTGLPLSYKSQDDVIAHPAENNEPTLFAYPSKVFNPGKNKIQLQVCESEWSDKFSLDTVGSYGFIACKTKDQSLEAVRFMCAQGGGMRKPKKYSVGVHCELSNFGMTKMVIFTPRYVCVNQTDYDISVAEPTGRWYDVPKGECVPFWPVDKKQAANMVVMQKDTGSATSAPFLFTDPHTTVLKLESEMGGVIVEVHVGETGNIVVFKPFQKDTFTIQLINHTVDSSIHFHQTDVTDQHYLSPEYAMLYTWQDPAKERVLTWNLDGKDYKNKLSKDGIGEVKSNAGKIIYWVSFLDGTQRKLLFTEDLAIATKAQQASELEQPDQEVLLSLPGLGLSLVNNINRTEVAYIGIRSSGIIWQNKVRKRFKDLSGREVKALEDGWQKFQVESMNNKDAPPKIYKLEHGLEVDFKNLSMLKPKHRPLKRTYHPGIWAQVRKSAHQLQLHTKINRMQIDNQMPAPVFPTILAPVPLPKSVAAESAAKPIIEVCLMMSFSDHSSVIKVKYMRLLVQEMHAKVDIGFLNNLMQVFASDQSLEGKEREYMDLDLAVVTTSLKEAESIKASLAREAVNYFDEFHLSPLKIHVSFSLSDVGDDSAEADGQTQVAKKASAGQNTLRFFLQSVGVTLTNVDDVLFKLGFFERKSQFYSQPQLVMEIVKHYTNQGIKQLYVLVLGLDVIGNPFGFVRGVSTGVKDFFYEPYQGIVQGPEEFAEGVALGMRSLFGHAVGGAAGAVSRITGTLGKGLAALTMDEEYKRKRQQAINQRPATFQEGIARGGKGLVMGFVEGATGIVKNPLQGAKKEGAKGFFKGVGRGLVGAVAKPTGGIIDFASGTLEGIRRVTEVGDEVGKLRSPRFLAPDGVVKPFNRDEALGLSLLHQVEKGKYAALEDYVSHMVLTTDKKHVLVITSKRVMLAAKGDVMGSWTVDFHYAYVDLKETPVLTEKGIQLLLKENTPKKGSIKRGLGLGLLKSKPAAGKMIQVPDRRQAEEFLVKLTRAMQALEE